MKTIRTGLLTLFLFIASICMVANASSQAAQPVKAGSVGNKVYLQIINNGDESIKGISIGTKNVPSFVSNIKIKPKKIRKIKAGKTTRVKVTFDIQKKNTKKEAQPLIFNLNAKKGHFSDTNPQLLLQLKGQKQRTADKTVTDASPPMPEAAKPVIQSQAGKQKPQADIYEHYIVTISGNMLILDCNDTNADLVANEFEEKVSLPKGENIQDWIEKKKKNLLKWCGWGMGVILREGGENDDPHCQHHRYLWTDVDFTVVGPLNRNKLQDHTITKLLTDFAVGRGNGPKASEIYDKYHDSRCQNNPVDPENIADWLSKKAVPIPDASSSVQTAKDSSGNSGNTGTKEKDERGQNATESGIINTPEVDLNPDNPQTATIIKEWLNRAEPLENAKGGQLRYDKWGRFHGKTASGGLITLNSSPDNPVSHKPEVHAWAHRQNLDSINLCSLEEYVIAKTKGNDLSHCVKNRTSVTNDTPEVVDKTGTQVNLPNVVGMSLRDAVTALEEVGLIALPELGESAPYAGNAGTVEVSFPEKEGPLRAGDTVIVKVFDEAIDSSNVPVVTGMQLTEASAAVKAAGLNPVFELGDETSDPKKDGTIYHQTPASGTMIGSGNTITMLIYTFVADTLKVPKLNGVQLSEAKRILDGKGLLMSPYLGDAAPKKSTEGMVYKQDPNPGKEISNGATVLVWVYGGYEMPQPIVTTPSATEEKADSDKMPDVIGYKPAAAAASLKKASFNPIFELGNATADPQKDGIVYHQTPAPGNSVESGSNVKLILYAYVPKTLKVPKLSGMRLVDAKRDLENKGLLMIPYLEKAAPKKSAEGRIYNQNPKPDQDVMNGVAIDVWVYGEYDSPEDKPIVAIADSSGVPFVDIPITLFGSRIRKLIIGRKQNQSFKGGRLKRPSNGFKDNSKGFRLIRIKYEKHFDLYALWNESKSDSLFQNSWQDTWCKQRLRKVSRDIQNNNSNWNTNLVLAVTDGKTEAIVWAAAYPKEKYWENNRQKEMVRVAEKLFDQIQPYALPCR